MISLSFSTATISFQSYQMYLFVVAEIVALKHRGRSIEVKQFCGIMQLTMQLHNNEATEAYNKYPAKRSFK